MLSQDDSNPIANSLCEKYRDEWQWWDRWLHDKVTAWYCGEVKELWGYPSPKVNGPFTVAEAGMAFHKADERRCPDVLGLDVDVEYGRLCDIGCGPLVPASAFRRAQVFSVDPILPAYRESGWPVDKYGAILIPHPIEELWMIPDDTFDTVISANAMNHVDDFERAVAELERIAKPDALIRIETEYTEATLAEPHILSDERVLAAFRKFKLKKLDQRSWDGHITSVIWST